MKVNHINHIGINVYDLAAAIAFFTDLGFTLEGEDTMQGELLDAVTGLKNAQTELVWLQPPDGQISLELIKYHQPIDSEGSQPPAPNTLGLGHLAFEIDNVEEIVATMKNKGYQLVGNVQNYQNIWKLCYIRGPQGIIVELSERLN